MDLSPSIWDWKTDTSEKQPKDMQGPGCKMQNVHTDDGGIEKGRTREEQTHYRRHDASLFYFILSFFFSLPLCLISPVSLRTRRTTYCWPLVSARCDGNATLTIMFSAVRVCMCREKGGEAVVRTNCAVSLYQPFFFFSFAKEFVIV